MMPAVPISGVGEKISKFDIFSCVRLSVGSFHSLPTYAILMPKNLTYNRYFSDLKKRLMIVNRLSKWKATIIRHTDEKQLHRMHLVALKLRWKNSCGAWKLIQWIKDFNNCLMSAKRLACWLTAFAYSIKISKEDGDISTRKIRNKERNFIKENNKS